MSCCKASCFPRRFSMPGETYIPQKLSSRRDDEQCFRKDECSQSPWLFFPHRSSIKEIPQYRLLHDTHTRLYILWLGQGTRSRRARAFFSRVCLSPFFLVSREIFVLRFSVSSYTRLLGVAGLSHEDCAALEERDGWIGIAHFVRCNSIGVVHKRDVFFR